MKTLVTILIGATLITLALFGYAKYVPHPPTSPSPKKQASTQKITNTPEAPVVSTIATGLHVPWALAFLPDGDLLVTERGGTVRIIRKDTGLDPNILYTINDAKEIGEGGLLGIALHPDYPKKPYIYFYYTYSGNIVTVKNRLVRFTFKNERFSDPSVLIDSIPAGSNHDGGRIKFGPDGYLYITTGDSGDPSLAQNKMSLAGKILRVTDEGEPVSENPFALGNENPLIYSYGHRNPQGLAWDSNGALWETEHGRSSPTGYDEVNLITPGKNYGWPTIQGNETKTGMETPIINSGPTTTWAPSGAVFADNSLFFAGLRGQTLYEAVIKDSKVTEFQEHFKGEFGRLRDVILGPDGYLYVTTSNRDGRGVPNSEDDRIIRMNPSKM
ncbi:MAG: PQQ-dependent sugar dehydrogenase [bacterium]|nr:PQQ-dependent sugar dehydrogenase [bacterium]